MLVIILTINVPFSSYIVQIFAPPLLKNILELRNLLPVETLKLN